MFVCLFVCLFVLWQIVLVDQVTDWAIRIKAGTVWQLLSLSRTVKPAEVDSDWGRRHFMAISDVLTTHNILTLWLLQTQQDGAAWEMFVMEQPLIFYLDIVVSQLKSNRTCLSRWMSICGKLLFLFVLGLPTSEKEQNKMTSNTEKVSLGVFTPLPPLLLPPPHGALSARIDKIFQSFNYWFWETIWVKIQFNQTTWQIIRLSWLRLLHISDSPWCIVSSQMRLLHNGVVFSKIYQTFLKVKILWFSIKNYIFHTHPIVKDLIFP